MSYSIEKRRKWKKYDFNIWQGIYTVRSYADKSHKHLETFILGLLCILAQQED